MPLKLGFTSQAEPNEYCLVKHNVGKQKDMLCDQFCYSCLMTKLNKVRICESNREDTLVQMKLFT